MARLRRHDGRRSAHRSSTTTNRTTLTRQARQAMLAALLLYSAGAAASPTSASTALTPSSPSPSRTTATATTASANGTVSSATPSPTVYIPSNAPTTGAAAATGIVRNYGYRGCFLDISGLNGTAPGTRSLQGDTTDEVLPGDMTVAKCLAFCGGGGSGTAYTYAGLEYARECWCGQDLSALAAQEPAAQCDLPCDGDSGTLCGGNLRLTLYALKSPAERPVAAIGTVLAVAGLAAVAQLL
ncbi:Mitochondrial intermediate peptidase [Sporothrix curviconia]|uniref:Mitochondrial intermediate peptidase n=1 Tax=Sporothrix curviconia TaxID=1260050 RepID=A0ABP0B8G6_9PEZI